VKALKGLNKALRGYCRELLIDSPYMGALLLIDVKKTLMPVQQNKQQKCQVLACFLQICGMSQAVC
jgi:hypothetical protein